MKAHPLITFEVISRNRPQKQFPSKLRKVDVRRTDISGGGGESEIKSILGQDEDKTPTGREFIDHKTSKITDEDNLIY